MPALRFLPLLLINVLCWGTIVPLPVGSLGLNVPLTLVLGALARGPRLRDSSRVRNAGWCIILYGLLVFVLGPQREGLLKVLFSSGLYAACLWAFSRLADRLDLSRPLLTTGQVLGLTAAVLFLPSLSFLLELSRAVVQANYYRPSYFFLEPSHLAITLGPLLYFAWISALRRQKIWVALTTVWLFVLFPASTFLALLLALLVFHSLAVLDTPRKLARGVLQLSLALLLTFLFFQLPIAERTRDRLSGTAAEITIDSNQSSIVYVNGWLLLAGYLDQSSGLGVGFNAMGFEPRPETAASPVLAAMQLEDLNAADGSFALSKLGSELGMLGIGIWLFSLYHTARLCHPRAAARLASSPANCLLLYSLLSGLSVEGVIRSVGYFSGPLMLAVFALMLACSRRPRSG